MGGHQCILAGVEPHLLTAAADPEGLATQAERRGVESLLEHHIAVAMELGADAILMNTAIAESQNPEQMATAMKLAVEAGRLAYLAGRMPKRLYASASSPITGAIK